MVAPVQKGNNPQEGGEGTHLQGPCRTRARKAAPAPRSKGWLVSQRESAAAQQLLR